MTWRLLHIDAGRELRGGQRQVALLARGLAARGHAVRLVVPRGAPLLAALAERPAGLELQELPIRGELSFRAILALRQMLARERWDLVHTHTPHAITLAHVARRRGTPLVAHRRVDFPLRRNPGARRKRGWPDAWIAVAEGVRGQLVADGVPPVSVHVVPSAIDPARLVPQRGRGEVRAELGLGPDAVAIGTVGHLAEHKGHRVLVEAVAQLGDRRAQLLMIGGGGLRAQLARRAGALGIGERVRWLGQRDDVADLLAALDIFAFPSISGEGSPASLKEALALGLPVVASDLPAHHEVGLPPDELVPAGDTPALARALQALLDDLPAARARAAARREAVRRNFRPDTLVERTLAVYEQVLGHPGPAGPAART
jgi:glycosyltransferase involved in cell wall biosynthesis